MTSTAKYWVALYTILLLALATLGATNRQLYREQQALIDKKEALMSTRTELRPKATAVTSAENAKDYAYQQKMVPASLLAVINRVPPSPAPVPSEPPLSGLEIKTLWRQ